MHCPPIHLKTLSQKTISRKRVSRRNPFSGLVLPLQQRQKTFRQRSIAGKYPQGLQVHSWTDIENKTPQESERAKTREILRIV